MDRAAPDPFNAGASDRPNYGRSGTPSRPCAAPPRTSSERLGRGWRRLEARSNRPWRRVGGAAQRKPGGLDRPARCCARKVCANAVHRTHAAPICASRVFEKLRVRFCYLWKLPQLPSLAHAGTKVALYRPADEFSLQLPSYTLGPTATLPAIAPVHPPATGAECWQRFFLPEVAPRGGGGRVCYRSRPVVAASRSPACRPVRTALRAH
jgi:hypothetical protein